MALTQLDLILKVGDGAIDSYKKSKRFYKNDKSNEGHDELKKAKRLVTNLYASLNLEKGGKIAEKLGKTYAYLLNWTN